VENEDIVVVNGRQEDSITLNSVFHVPGMKKNIFSIVNVVEDVTFVLFGRHDVKFLRNFKVLKSDAFHTGKRVNDLFVFSASGSYIEKKKSNSDNAYLWHAKPGHLSMDKLKAMVKLKLINGLPNLSSLGGGEMCEGCQFGKENRLPFYKSTSRCKARLNFIHSDLMGPTRTP